MSECVSERAGDQAIGSEIVGIPLARNLRFMKVQRNKETRVQLIHVS